MKLRAVLSLTLLAGVAGCIADDDTLGGVSMSLVGAGASGDVYRLAGAQLDLVGPTVHHTYTTDDDPDRAQIVERVPAGVYVLDLSDAWRLERLFADGTASEVDATLTSPDPLPLDVVAGAQTAATLRFRVGGDDVSMGEGDVVIDIDVEEAGGADAGPVDGLPDPAGPFVRIVIAPPALTTSPVAYFQWDAINALQVTCAMDAAPPTPCQDEYTSATLLEGSHTFVVRAIHADGRTATDAHAFFVDLP